MKYTYQYKALPTTEQKLELNLWLRTCQYWYNRQIGDRFDWWENNRSPVNACPLVTALPELRDTFLVGCRIRSILYDPRSHSWKSWSRCDCKKSGLHLSTPCLSG
ncbi:helix-turn-helix domain-containing protein [Nostoc sp. CCCryo 231-06]|nr:helix-turn-helix domain-containing protein [Nostoc sp. CCCryo 231-06]